MNKLHTRKSDKSDKAWLYHLYSLTMRRYIEETWGWDEKYQRNEFETNLVSEIFEILFVEEHKVCAYLLLDKSDHLWLEMLLIDPKNQRQGFGTWVVNKLQQESKAKGKPLKLGIIKINPVKSFYEKLGFRQYEEDEYFYRMSWGS